MTSETPQLIVCPHCDTVNRLPAHKQAGEAKCGNCHKPVFTGLPVEVTQRSFEKHIRNDAIPVVVDFWASWCGPCKIMSPTFEKVASELEPEFRFLKVDTEAEHGLAARYDVRSIPLLMIFKSGRVVAQRAGVISAEPLRIWIKQSVWNHARTG